MLFNVNISTLIQFDISLKIKYQSTLTNKKDIIYGSYYNFCLIYVEFKNLHF